MTTPLAPSTLFQRGNRSLGEGRAVEALADFDLALQAVGAHPDILNSRGIALQMLGPHGEALAAFDRALAFAATNPAIHANRGAVLAELGRLHDAARSLGTYTTSTISANGELILLMSTIEAGAKITSSASIPHHVVAIGIPALIGHLMHLMNNPQVGVVTNMNTVCVFPTQMAPPTGTPVTPNNPSGAS